MKEKISNRKFSLIYIALQILLLIGAVFFFICWKTNSLFEGWTSYYRFYSFMQALLMSLIPYVLLLFRVKITKTLQVYFTIMLMGHFIGGNMLYLYSNSLYYDAFLHFMNSALLGVVIYNLLKKNVKTKNKFVMSILVVACVLLVGILWEIVEWTSDALWNSNMQRYNYSSGPHAGEPFVGRMALMDTMKDICLDIFGGIMTCVLVFSVKIKKVPLDEYFSVSIVSRKKSVANDSLDVPVVANNAPNIDAEHCDIDNDENKEE